MDKWVALAVGIFLIIYGSITKTPINESEVAATEEERANAKATPLKRVLVVGTGMACCLYVLMRVMR
jgi:hypothetical protein